MEIKLKRLSMENFKCHKALTLDFDGRNASIHGDNATGKTSIYDALTWLLFGKDSLGSGEKNMEIKPLNAAGEVADHQAVTEVEAVLTADGEEVSLRRTYQEIWSTRRGNPEPVYGGNTSEYFVDGVPCKKFAFEQRVKQIIDPDTWLMLTSVSYFAKDLSWQKRREILFKICGTTEDKAIMETREDFAPLLTAMGKLSLDDFKAKLLAQKKGLVGTRNEIPARINECEKTVKDLASLDFDGAQQLADALNFRRGQITGKLASIDHNTAADGKKVELDKAQLELRTLEAENKAFRDNQVRPKPDTRNERNEIAFLERRLSRAQDAIGGHERCVKRYEQDIQNARADWMKVNAEEFRGTGKCPTCGQTLPAEQRQWAMDGFEADKNRRLSRIEDEADRAKRQKAKAETALKQAQADIDHTKAEIEGLKEQIEEAESQWSQPEIKDMDGYEERHNDLTAWIAALQDELYQLKQDAHAAGADLRRELDEVDEALKAQMVVLGKKDVLAYSEERMDKLRQEAEDGAEKLNEVERLLWLMEDFVRYKTSFVEDSVNGSFRLARFRLFREQANGGLEDRCDVVFDGIPYNCLNNGARINVGIDIINTLSRAYGVSLPLFVDNAESVTRLEGSASQTVRLVVSEHDKELRANYEN